MTAKHCNSLRRTASRSCLHEKFTRWGTSSAVRDRIIRRYRGVRIWTGPHCAGKSQIITEDVIGLSTIGFDNAITSVASALADGTQTSPLRRAPVVTATSASLTAARTSPSQTATSPSCANSGQSIQVSLIQVARTYKIWTGPECSGTSKIVHGNSLDLEPLGFGTKVASVRFAG